MDKQQFHDMMDSLQSTPEMEQPVIQQMMDAIRLPFPAMITTIQRIHDQHEYDYIYGFATDTLFSIRPLLNRLRDRYLQHYGVSEQMDRQHARRAPIAPVAVAAPMPAAVWLMPEPVAEMAMPRAHREVEDPWSVAIRALAGNVAHQPFAMGHNDRLVVRNPDDDDLFVQLPQEVPWAMPAVEALPLERFQAARAEDRFDRARHLTESGFIRNRSGNVLQDSRGQPINISDLAVDHRGDPLYDSEGRYIVRPERTHFRTLHNPEMSTQRGNKKRSMRSNRMKRAKRSKHAKRSKRSMK